jgi:group II intron reverse transcriptase/maturase
VEVRVIRNADTILTVIRERGRRGLPLERVYRLLYNPDLYLKAYAKLYRNQGAMTRGSTPETVDGMSEQKIDSIIDALRYERYQWTPVRRTYIAKKHSTKKRPLGLPSWSDKVLQEVIRLILEAYYEPHFSELSHGFRPERGCHTALQTIQQTWTGTKWFIEGDISKYFDTISHTKLIEILARNVKDERFLGLMRKLLDAGYMEEGVKRSTLSGAPQGAVLSPLLSNVYLNEFDQWVETTLIPTYTRGTRRKWHPEYRRICHKLTNMKRRGKTQGIKSLLQRRRQLPSYDPRDPDYRRLRYTRYADDFLFGFVGTRQEAEEIKRLIKEWLGTHLHLTLSEEKTLITHASTQKARFLGYNITTFKDDTRISAFTNSFGTRVKIRSVNEVVGLYVPHDVIVTKCANYERNGKPIHRSILLEDSDYDIVTRYQQEYRGIVQYYLLAHNIGKLTKLRWVMLNSLLNTLAAKHKTSSEAIRAKYQTTTTTTEGKTLQCLEVTVEREGRPPLIARFGDISLTRCPQAKLDDLPTVTRLVRTELIQRLLANECELCGSTENVEVHHIRKLADLRKRYKGRAMPAWARHMAARRRKTLVACRICHNAIHAGKYDRNEPLESRGALKGASPVRGGTAGNVP